MIGSEPDLPDARVEETCVFEAFGVDSQGDVVPSLCKTRRKLSQ
jgi:hypothetical protein